MASTDPAVILANAKVQYDRLVTGMAARVVLDGNNGDRVEYQGANAAALLDYIRTMDPTYLVPADPTSYISRPFRFIF